MCKNITLFEKLFNWLYRFANCCRFLSYRKEIHGPSNYFEASETCLTYETSSASFQFLELLYSWTRCHCWDDYPGPLEDAKVVIDTFSRCCQRTCCLKEIDPNEDVPKRISHFPSCLYHHIRIEFFSLWKLVFIQSKAKFLNMSKVLHFHSLWQRSCSELEIGLLLKMRLG